MKNLRAALDNSWAGFLMMAAVAPSVAACGGDDAAPLLDVTTHVSNPRDFSRSTSIDLGTILASRDHTGFDSVILTVGAGCVLAFEWQPETVCAFHTLYGCGMTKEVFRWNLEAPLECVLDVPGLSEPAKLGLVLDPWDISPDPVHLSVLVELSSSGEHIPILITEQQ